MKSRGFTIVELLIVIVVIAILAAITIVAYNGIQARARDNIRYQDVKSIMKALELYKADKGYYPSWQKDYTWKTTATTCSTSPSNGYSYSSATDGSWLKPLVDGGYLSKVPTPPGNDCDSYFRYLDTGNPVSYGCTSRTTSWYMIEVTGVETDFTPKDAADSDSYNWKPCEGATASFGSGATRWVFVKDDV